MEKTCPAELELDFSAMKRRFKLLCREVDTQVNIDTHLKGQAASQRKIVDIEHEGIEHEGITRRM